MKQHTTSSHTWRFFRAGGFDQVRIDSGGDICHLRELDRKLWVALACPTRGLEFDHKTLDLIDTDKDGRIRAPELLAATEWICGLLKDPNDLVKTSATLPLSAINDGTAEGKQLLASAKQILVNLGKGEATELALEDTSDTVRIFAQTKFNGDGVIPVDAPEDAGLQGILADVLACSDLSGGGAKVVMDRSGKPGVTQEMVDRFFAEARAFAEWRKQPETDTAKRPLGEGTGVATEAVKAIAGKVEDYFARCRLAAFDPRAAGVINRDTADYATLAPKDLSTAEAEIAAFPLAAITPNGTLPLGELRGINPAWREAVEEFRALVVEPLLGKKDHLTEEDWEKVLTTFAPFNAWLAAKAGHAVEKLGEERVAAILASHEGKAQELLTGLIAKDAALAPEATSIDKVEKLVRLHRDLHKLLNNFVSFRDFYRRHEKAVFQVGTLYLDQRSCDLCVRVEDAAKHGLMAHLSRTYLAYCDCSRKGADGTVEKMTIAAAFTGGDSDNLMVGRNGVFFDRQGHDWDATITKIIENPISIRQAFFAPYKRAIRWVGEQMAKRAADADAAASTRFQATAGHMIDHMTGKAVPPPPAPVKPKIDAGVVAALSVAAGFILGAVGATLQAFFGLGAWMPLGVVAILLLISGPSMLIAFFKLRQRNLGPILDANGWAVNAKAKINIPFGRSLTGTPKLPPGSHRDLVDPYAEKHAGRNWTIAICLVFIAGWAFWFFGGVEHFWPGALPKSQYVVWREQQAEKKGEPTTVPASQPVIPAAK